MVIAKKKKTAISRKGDILFYWGILLLPLIQIAIFYFAVNINSFLMAFQKYNPVKNSYYFVNGFENFAQIFREMSYTNTMKFAIGNSVFLYFWGLLVNTPLPIIFSYYIYKNKMSGGIIKLLLFIPSIIPATTLGTLYFLMGNSVCPELDLIAIQNQSRWQVWFSLVLIGMPFGFGANVIMYSGAMSGIDQSLSEAAQIDGAGPMQEFIHLTLPMVWPTFATFTTVGIASIFTNQANLFTIFPAGAPADNYTIGYFLFKEVANVESASLSQAQQGYPVLSAYAMLFTACAIPLVYLMKFIMAKIGPSVE